jgi:hypothetical protein
MISFKLVGIAGATLFGLSVIAQMQQQAPTTPAPTTVQIVKETRPVPDGCELAGAIPDCKAVMAKLIAVQALHPPEYHGRKPGDEPKSGGGDWPGCNHDMKCQRSNIDDALAYAISGCRREYDGPSQSTQQLLVVCIAGAQAYANDKMSNRN